MQKLLFIFFFIPAVLSVNPVYAYWPIDDDPGERAWLLRPSYTHFNEGHWMEIGIGRMNSIYLAETDSNRRLRIASAGFTMGMEISPGRQMIIAPKMGMEVCATLFGARVTYAYFMQEEQRNGVIGIEGGFCILSFCYAYVGYNFVKGDRDSAIVPSGGKISVGFNLHLWKKKMSPPKKLGER